VGDLSVGEGVFAAHKVSGPNSIIHIVEDKQPGEQHIGNAFFSMTIAAAVGAMFEASTIAGRTAIHSWIRTPPRKCFPSS